MQMSTLKKIIKQNYIQLFMMIFLYFKKKENFIK